MKSPEPGLILIGLLGAIRLLLSEWFIPWILKTNAPPNNSLDRSGGSVFRIMTGPAMLD